MTEKTGKTEGPVVGPDGEKWADWLVPNKKEFNQIENSSLKVEVMLLARRPFSMISASTLEESYSRLENLLRNNELDENEAALWMGRIGEKHSQMVEQAKSAKPPQETQAKGRNIAYEDDGNGRNSSAETIAKALGIPGAAETLDLYRRAEGQMMAIGVEVGKEPKFLIGAEQRTKELWIAKSLLSTACSIKLKAQSFDELAPNEAAGAITIEDLDVLLEQPGAWEAFCLYSALIAGKTSNKAENVGLNPKEILVNSIQAEQLHNIDDRNRRQKLESEKEELGRVCPEDIFKITSKDVLLNLRKAMTFWLEAKGLPAEKATDAEHSTWNLIYLSNMFEQYDSKVYRPSAKRATPLSGLKAMAQWMVMHPQERLEAKVNQGEAWSRLGEWALYRKNSLHLDVPEILPKVLIKNAFAMQEERMLIGGRTLEQIVVANGLLIANGHDDQYEPKPELTMKENPILQYYLDAMSPAITLFQVIAKGSPKDTDWSRVGDSFRKIKDHLGKPLSQQQKEVYLMATEGVKSRSRNLVYSGGNAQWGDVISAKKRYFPTLFND